MGSFVTLVGYLLLFTVVAAVFLLSTLLIGKLVRPTLPNAEKDAIYECGEPTIGSSWVQFDLRFYVVALLFVIFDVEVAFFFPWAAVYGKVTRITATSGLDPAAASTEVQKPLSELGLAAGAADTPTLQQSAHNLALIAFVDLLVFFGVVLIGFFYLWKRGDLDWVRAATNAAMAEPVSTWSEATSGAPVTEPAEAATV
jgi:NADH-quinone oxidoreductase subunit A